VSKLSLGVEKVAATSAVVAMPPILPTSRAKLSEVALSLPDDFNFEEWQQLGHALDRMEHAVQWWRGDWWAFGQHRYGDRLALVGPERFKSYHNAGTVSRAIESARRRALLSFSHHAEVAPFPKSEQDAWLDRAEAAGWSVMELRRELRRANAVARLTAVLPAGRFNVIQADPPWQYDFVEADNRAIENQYPTLPVEAICDYHDDAGRSITEVVADDAVLFLWATNPKLREALQVVEAWGFEYVTNAVWVKDQIGMGYYVRQKHELLLIGRRGVMPPPPDMATRPPSVIEAPRRGHSVKPVEAYELVEAMYPTGKWLECFARSGREGWAAFGNQLEQVA
jgi:N6-adenosine-specific RNA methylase IME4